MNIRGGLCGQIEYLNYCYYRYENDLQSEWNYVNEIVWNM